MTRRRIDDPLPTASQLRRRLVRASLSLSIAATLLIALYLVALLRLPGEQWRAFGVVVAALFPVLFWLQDRVGRRLWAPLADCLERVHAGRAEPADLRRGFASAVNLPVRGQRIGPLWWAVGGLVVAAVMKLRYDTFTWLSTLVMVAATVSGGYVMAVFHFFVVKRVLAPVRAALAEALPDPVERASLVEGTTLSAKLRFAITGVTVFTVMFAIFCAHVRSMRPVEAHAARIQSRFLEQVVDRLDWDGTVALRFAREEAQRLGIADELLLLDPTDLEVVAGRPEALPVGERRLLVEADVQEGDSTRFDSPQVLTWRHLPDEGLVLVAVSRWEPLMGEVRETRIVFAVLLLGATGIALVLAWLLSDDVSSATAALGREAERLSRGDLRRGRSFESEDELGTLSRAFEAMGDSLRGLVGRTSLAADRVEVTAGAMAEVAADVAALTADQVSGIRQTGGSMEAIHGQVRGIADSAQVLNASVEESSSSVLELGAAGEELNDTANVLSERVNEVSGSIGQMVASVRQVMENTETLAEAAVETSASMGEMAASMREVDAAAEQTARLSEQVVETAESGQRKTAQMIEGMEAIRESTETAERVIHSLGDRASEIGAIVDVIDDVADETHLLALNAAIIAAQAGEQGRAFSVVADEIKDLAERTLTSTREIGGLIRAVQEESANAIGAIERGSASVAGGVRLSAEAGVALEEITESSRASGRRTAEIVQAVREQARAARHVVELTERVRGGVEEIAAAAREQDRGNEVVHAGAVVMRDVASQLRGTTEEQARGSRRIRESVEGVREAMEQINQALQEQSAACRSAVEFLEAMHQRTRVGETSASRLDGVAKELIDQAETLRRELGRFRI